MFERLATTKKTTAQRHSCTMMKHLSTIRWSPHELLEQFRAELSTKDISESWACQHSRWWESVIGFLLREIVGCCFQLDGADDFIRGTTCCRKCSTSINRSSKKTGVVNFWCIFALEKPSMSNHARQNIPSIIVGNELWQAAMLASLALPIFMYELFNGRINHLLTTLIATSAVRGGSVSRRSTNCGLLSAVDDGGRTAVL